MGTFIFWTAVLFSAYWTFMSIKHRTLTVGHSWQIVTSLMLWGAVVYFFHNPHISRFHLLWVMPLIMLASPILAAIVFTPRRRELEKKMQDNLDKLPKS